MLRWLTSSWAELLKVFDVVPEGKGHMGGWFLWMKVIVVVLPHGHKFFDTLPIKRWGLCPLP